LCLWRLRRVASYETAVTALGIEEVPEDIRREAGDPFAQLASEKPLPVRLTKAEKQLEEDRDKLAKWEGADRLLEGLPDLPSDAQVRGEDVWDALQQLMSTVEEHYDSSELPDTEDADWLVGLGVPEDEVRDAYKWSGWTAGMARVAWEQIAEAAQVQPSKLLTRTIADSRKSQAETRERIQELEKKIKLLCRLLRTREDRLRQRRVLPDEKTLEKVTRYEAHLSRQMLQALHTLECLQAARAGQTVPPPAALDVTVDADGTSQAQPFLEGAATVLEHTGGG
jgi:hypothetical protein